jgi:hypothetical protein
VLFVPGASEDLISLGKLTKVSYTGVMHAGILKLLYADASRKDKVALAVSTVNNVFPIKVRNAERTDAEIMQVTHKLQAHAKVTDQARTAFPRLVTAKHIGEEKLPVGQGQAYINHCKFGHKAGRAGRLGLSDIPPGTCASCMIAGMPNLKEPDEDKRTAEHTFQYMAIDTQGSLPVSIRGNRNWVAVIDICTKLKLSFPAPTLQAAMKILDHVLKRECNRAHRDVQGVFQLANQPRKLDTTAEATGDLPDEVGEARHQLNQHLSQFDGVTGNCEKLQELRARPVTIGIMRMDGGPNQRGREINKMAAELGASAEYPVPHDHKAMGRVEGFHPSDLKSGMAQMHDACAPAFMWDLFMENGRDADHYIRRPGQTVYPYTMAHSHVELK